MAKSDKRAGSFMLDYGYRAEGGMKMEYEAVIQSALDEIDRKIMWDIHVEDLAPRRLLFHPSFPQGIYAGDRDAGHELYYPAQAGACAV